MARCNLQSPARNLRVAIVLSTALLTSAAFGDQSLELVPFSQDLDFGVIANEDGVCRMNDRGSLIGLAGQSCLGSGSRAIFNVTGAPGRVINISATGGNNGMGVSFEPSISGSLTKVIAANGSAPLVIAGDLVLQNAKSGQHAIEYIVCVYYE